MQSEASDDGQVEPSSAFAMLKVDNNKVSAFSSLTYTDLKKPIILIKEKEGDFLGNLFRKEIKEARLKNGKLCQGFNTVNHPTIKSGDLYYCLFESYIPEYEIVTTKSSLPNMPDSKSEKFKNVRIGHVQLACFDVEGNLQWDQNYKLKGFTFPRGTANTIWTVDEDGTVITLTEDNGKTHLLKVHNGEILQDEDINYRNCFTKEEWKEVDPSDFYYPGILYGMGYLAIPLTTETGNFVICYVTHKGQKNASYINFRPYKF